MQNDHTLDTEFIKAPGAGARHLMIVLHGLGDSSAGFRWMPGALNLPWLNYLLVNAPDPYYGGHSWYDFTGDAAVGVARSRKLLFELIEAQQARGFSPAETFLFGFSQGCLMTIDVGLRHPRAFAGLIGISGYVHEPELLVRELSPVATQQRLLITHGTIDPLIPFAGVREQINMLKGAGVNVEWHEFMKAHTIAGEAEVDLIRNFVRSGGPQS